MFLKKNLRLFILHSHFCYLCIKYMKNILCYSFCLLFGVQQVAAQIVSIRSPDNKIVLNIKSGHV